MAARRWLLLLILAAVMASLLAAPTAGGQGDSPPLLEVYILDDVPQEVTSVDPALSRIIFIDALSGEETHADVRGEHFTLLGGYVLFQDAGTGGIFRAWPDGRVEPHPFIQPTAETLAVAWAVSPDQAWIAWTLVNRAGEADLATITTLARADGSEQRLLLTDGPDAFFHVKPVALTNDGAFFFDRQPTGIDRYFFYEQYAAIYWLPAGAAEAQLLPFEPNCFCGAALSPDGAYFARLEQVTGEGGYEVRVWDLTTGRDTFIPMLPVPPLPYEMAGNVLIAPDGGRVIYSLANNLTIDSAGTGSERFMLALADVANAQQTPLFEAQLRQPLLPYAWSDGGAAALLYNPREDGTWKLVLDTGELIQVAAGRYLGALSGG